MLCVIFHSFLQHLSISNGNIQVDASFMQTLWNVHPICSGSNIEQGIEYIQNNQPPYCLHSVCFIKASHLMFFFKHVESDYFQSKGVENLE